MVLERINVPQNIMEQLDNVSFAQINESALLAWIGKLICHGERTEAKIAETRLEHSKGTVMHLTNANGATFNSIGSVTWQLLGVAVNAYGLGKFVTNTDGVKAAQVALQAAQTASSITQMPANYLEKWCEADRDSITSRRQAVTEGSQYLSQQKSEAGQKINTTIQKMDEISRTEAEAKRGINQ